MPPDSSGGKDCRKEGSICTISITSTDRARIRSSDQVVWARITSSNVAWIRLTGFSAFMLFWNTVDRSRQRIARSSSS